jgi:hypothetical protein
VAGRHHVAGLLIVAVADLQTIPHQHRHLNIPVQPRYCSSSQLHIVMLASSSMPFF